MSTISVSHLSKTYTVAKKYPGVKGTIKSVFLREHEEIKAVSDVSFEIDEGEVVGFIGPNGAGKTTTLKCLSGLLYPTSGKVSVLGHVPFQRKNAFLKQISLVMGQKNQLWWDLPAMDSFLLSKEVYEIPDGEFKKTLDELSDLLAVKDILFTPVKKLSLGQRMKMEFIAALLHSPKVLFLDEPTIGLDVIMQKNIREFLKEYNRKHKSTIILTSHYMEDVEDLCKRVIVINHGTLLYDGSLEKLIKKYSPVKVVSVILRKSIDLEKVSVPAEVILYNHPRLSLRVNSKEVNTLAAHLLQKFDIEDITIEESSIDDVIREVFREKK